MSIFFSDALVLPLPVYQEYFLFYRNVFEVNLPHASYFSGVLEYIHRIYVMFGLYDIETLDSLLKFIDQEDMKCWA